MTPNTSHDHSTNEASKEGNRVNTTSNEGPLLQHNKREPPLENMPCEGVHSAQLFCKKVSRIIFIRAYFAFLIG